MKCPKCGFKMKDNYCMHCGYMKNGNTISNKESNPSASDLEIYLGDKFDTLYYNENTFLIFILGPLYFCYQSYILLGFLCLILDLVLYYLVMITSFCYSGLKLIGLFFGLRVLYMTVSNMICLKLYERRINKLKKKDPVNCLERIQNVNGKTTSIFGVLVLLLLLGICFLIAYLIIKK